MTDTQEDNPPLGTEEIIGKFMEEVGPEMTAKRVAACMVKPVMSLAFKISRGKSSSINQNILSLFIEQDVLKALKDEDDSFYAASPSPAFSVELIEKRFAQKVAEGWTG